MRETQTRIRLSSRKRMLRRADHSGSSRSPSGEKLSVHGHKTGSAFYPHDPLGGGGSAVKGLPAIRVGDSPAKSMWRLNAPTVSGTLEQSKPSLSRRAAALPAIPFPGAAADTARDGLLKYSID